MYGIGRTAPMTTNPPRVSASSRSQSVPCSGKTEAELRHLGEQNNAIGCLPCRLASVPAAAAAA